MSKQILRCGKYELDLERPLIMAIINLTPDSFSGDGIVNDVAAVVKQAKRAVAEGADILDIGGESTRPGAQPVKLEDERSRVLPVLEALYPLDVPISVDTSKPGLMQEVIGCGASMINDINALRAPGAIDAVAKSNVALCVMHMQATPASMQTDPTYRDVVAEVSDFLSRRVRDLVKHGVTMDRVVVDPGIGFGKNPAHNIELLRKIHELKKLAPILIGVSRKSILGEITGRHISQRTVASAVVAYHAMLQGAKILRVHDVGSTADARSIYTTLMEAR